MVSSTFMSLCWPQSLHYHIRDSFALKHFLRAIVPVSYLMARVYHRLVLLVRGQHSLAIL